MENGIDNMEEMLDRIIIFMNRSLGSFPRLYNSRRTSCIEFVRRVEQIASIKRLRRVTVRCGEELSIDNLTREPWS